MIYWGYIGILLGFYWGSIGGYIGIMEKKMETTIMGFLIVRAKISVNTIWRSVGGTPSILLQCSA